MVYHLWLNIWAFFDNAVCHLCILAILTVCSPETVPCGPNFAGSQSRIAGCDAKVTLGISPFSYHIDGKRNMSLTNAEQVSLYFVYVKMLSVMERIEDEKLLLADRAEVKYNVCHSILFAVQLSEASIFQYSSRKYSTCCMLLAPSAVFL